LISGHDRSDQRLDTDDVHDPCQIVGLDRECHFRGYFRKRFGQEVCRAFNVTNGCSTVSRRVSRAFLVAALSRLGRLEEATDETRRLLDLDSTFSIQRFSVTVDIEPTVFLPLAEAWQRAGLPAHLEQVPRYAC
jgi:hypothetical protein